jgi:hypothetical protein
MFKKELKKDREDKFKIKDDIIHDILLNSINITRYYF